MAAVKRRVQHPMGRCAIATGSVFVPSGGWEDISGITAARATGEMRGRTGNMQVQAAVQTANDIRSPDTPAIGIGAIMNTDGVGDPTGETAISSGAKQFIRPGWLVSLTSGATLAFAVACGEVQLIST